VVFSRKRLGPRDAVDSAGCIFIATCSSLGVPSAGFLNVNWNVDAHLVKVSKRKLGGGQAALRGPLSIGKSSFVVLLKQALMATQKPFADGHFGLGFALPRG
jgi:hypothetical protein